MPSLNPWLYLGVLIAFVALGTGSFFYGQHLGYQRRQAEEVDVIGKQFAQYATDARTAAFNGTAAALADFKAKTELLAAIADQLKSAKGVMDNAAARLSASLRGGSCVLNPDQRRLLECIRRPGGAACQPAPSR